MLLSRMRDGPLLYQLLVGGLIPAILIFIFAEMRESKLYETVTWVLRSMPENAATPQRLVFVTPQTKNNSSRSGWKPGSALTARSFQLSRCSRM